MLLFGLFEDIGPLLGAAATIFWIWMLIDCFHRAKVAPNRVGWLILIFFTHWVGALIYFFSYVNPLGKFFQSTPQPPVQKKPFIYYTPPTQTSSYQEYQQGYQTRSVPYPPPTNVPYQQEDQQQTSYTASDYEEPHATYPEMPSQEQ